MSSIPTKQIDGDVAIGRNISAGGNANVQGSARIGHDLKVEGWFEAKNIRGVNKGVFASVTDLRETYPKPHNGWFAGVPASAQDIADLGLTVQEGKTLFRMYVGKDEKWVCEPLDKLYEIAVDIREVSTLRENVTTLQGGYEILDNNVATLNKWREELTGSIGEPGGIAPLTEEGVVQWDFLDPDALPVREFAAFVSGITVQTEPTIQSSTTTGCLVVYNTDTKRFLLAMPKNDTDGSGNPFIPWTFDPETGERRLRVSGFNFYAEWSDADYFGRAERTDGRIPDNSKLYICTSKDSLYRWDGTALILAAFPTKAGQALETKYTTLNGHVVAIDSGRELFINLNRMTDNANPMESLADALDVVPEKYRLPGVCLMVPEPRKKQYSAGQTYIGLYISLCLMPVNIGCRKTGDNILWIKISEYPLRNRIQGIRLFFVGKT